MKINNLFFFLLFLFCFYSCGNKKELIIGIQPFGKVNEIEIDSIKKGLELIYSTQVIVLNPIELPQFAFTNVKSPRYRADILIKYLKENKTDSLDYVIGYTNKDISTTKTDSYGKTKLPKQKYEDWGIFGLGYRPGPSCIVSSFRLKHKNKQKFIGRIQKVTAHEIGHNIGLKHCSSGLNCIMKDAVESIKTVDNETFNLCESCKKKL